MTSLVYSLVNRKPSGVYGGLSGWIALTQVRHVDTGEGAVMVLKQCGHLVLYATQVSGEPGDRTLHANAGNASQELDEFASNY